MENNGLLDESLNYCMDYEYWPPLGGNGVRFAYILKKSLPVLECMPKINPWDLERHSRLR